MDKWDELTHRIQQSILAEEPDAAVAAAFQTIAEFGRTLETISSDLDRIATAVEAQNAAILHDDDGIPPELRHEEPEPLEHDL